MSYRIKAVVSLALIVGPQAAWALEPCKPEVTGITIIAGPYVPLPPNVVKLMGEDLKKDPLAVVEGGTVKVPPAVSPDSEKTNPDGSVQTQGWHNLRKAQRPVKLICRYGDKRDTVALPDGVDVCLFSPGRVICQ